MVKYNIACIAQSILRDYPRPRLIFFDTHNEYSNAFSGPWAEQANCLAWNDFNLPYWFLDFEEFIGIYYKDAGETQKMNLKNLIEELKKGAVEADFKERVSVDSPVYFDIDDLVVKVKQKSDAESMVKQTRNLGIRYCLKSKV